MRDAARSGGAVSSSASWARPVGRNRSWTAVRNIAVCRPWSVTSVAVGVRDPGDEAAGAQPAQVVGDLSGGDRGGIEPAQLRR